MLDGVDPGADGQLDAGRAVGMGGDLEAPEMRFLGNRGQLGEGQLRLPRLGVAAEHPAGGADLDHFGAVLALFAHLLAQLVRAVAHRRALGLEAGRQVRLVAMPARRAERVVSVDDPRPRDPAFLDPLVDPGNVVVPVADIAHGGETGLEHLLGIGDAEHGGEPVGELEAGIAAVFRPAVQVDMHVDQAGQQGVPGEVDHLRTRRSHAAALDCSDLAVGDRDQRRRDIFAGLDVEQAVGLHIDGFRLCSAPDSKRGQRNGEGDKMAGAHVWSTPVFKVSPCLAPPGAFASGANSGPRGIGSFMAGPPRS